MYDIGKNCKVCMIECKDIIKYIQVDKSRALNKNDETYGSCNCHCRFHKFSMVNLPRISTLMMCKTQIKVPVSTKFKLKIRKCPQFVILDQKVTTWKNPLLYPFHLKW